MSDRSLLGPADVSDTELAGLVADLWGVPSVALGDVSVDEVAYDIPAITTGGRWWVRGTAGTAPDLEARDFCFFVKQIQSWSRSPFFAEVPPEAREMAAASVPWRTEGLVYRSDLAQRLPDGLSLPRALAVRDLDELSMSLWLEPVPHTDWPWDLARFTRAAFLLGRLAGSSQVAPLAGVGEFAWHTMNYVGGRLSMQVFPILHGDGVWEHPLIAPTFDAQLRDRLRAASDQIEAHAHEFESGPRGSAHGDACPNNLLGVPGDPDRFVLIDFGYWMPQPLGYDLSQLLVGEVQLGRFPAARLPELEAAIVPAYAEGLRAEGVDVPEAVIRRAHALQLLIYSGVSALPFEYLDAEPTPELVAMAHERAAIARFSLDLLDATT